MGKEDDVDDLLPLYTTAWEKEQKFRKLSGNGPIVEESVRLNRKERERILQNQKFRSGEWTFASTDARETGNVPTAMCAKGAARRNYGGLPYSKRLFLSCYLKLFIRNL